MLKPWHVAIAALMALACAPALAADNYTVQSGGQTRQVRAKEITGVLHPVSIPFDANGAPLFTNANVGYVALGAALPAGTNVIGGVTISGSVPLPTGAATAGNQGTANTSLASIDGKLPAQVSGRVPVDGSGVTQPVSASALPLPSGAATATNQTTANSSLASIDTKVTGLATASGQATAGSALAAMSGAITPVSSSALEASHVLKASAGSLYGFTATTTTSAGYVLLFDASSAPADGAATPLKVYAIAAGQTIAGTFNPPIAVTTGATLVFSTTGPFTKTGSATAFLSGDVK